MPADPPQPGPKPGFHYFWTYLDEKGNRRRMRWMMTPETAAEYTELQGLECDLSSSAEARRSGWRCRRSQQLASRLHEAFSIARADQPPSPSLSARPQLRRYDA